MDDWADDDRQNIQRALSAAENDPENSQLHFEKVFAAAHNLKGMGASFEFNLASEISGLLCDHLRADFEGDIQVVSLHIKSLEFVLDQDMRGDGGERRLLFGGLQGLTKKE